LRLNQIQWHIIKHVGPPRGMCKFKHYFSTTNKYVTIRNWDNIKHPMTPYDFKLSFIFICLSIPWQLAQQNCIFFPFTINFHAKYFNLYYLHKYFLVTSSIPQLCACNCKKKLLQWQKENCRQIVIPNTL
jgi:hypothetical protein